MIHTVWQKFENGYDLVLQNYKDSKLLWYCFYTLNSYYQLT